MAGDPQEPARGGPERRGAAWGGAGCARKGAGSKHAAWSRCTCSSRSEGSCKCPRPLGSWFHPTPLELAFGVKRPENATSPENVLVGEL